jgi:hypothetical protein
MKFTKLSLAATLLFPAFLLGQMTKPVSPPDERTPRQVASGAARLMGAYEPAQKLRLVFALKRPKPDEEQKFLDALYKEGTPEYRKFLTPEEWNKRFAPSEADEQAVVNWATAQGLTVTNRYANRLIVDVEAPVAQIQKALAVRINRYQLDGRTVFSNDRDPAIPKELSGIVSGVIGLNSIHVMRPHSKSVKPLPFPDYSEGPTAALVSEVKINGDRGKLAEAMAAKKQKGASPAFTGGMLDPADIYSSEAYNFNGLFNLGHCCNPNQAPGGAPPEATIAIATAGAQQISDIQGFQKQFPYLAFHLSYINVDGTPPCCDGEGTMDAEWASATSNSFDRFEDTGHVYVYQGVNNLHATFIDVFNRMLNDGHARVMSTSWGCAEVLCATISVMDTETAIFNAMTGQGWTLIADADDKGSVADCAHQTVEFPASSPNVIAAGGTHLNLFSDSTFSNEVAWTGGTFAGACNINDGGGGGGFSAVYGVPSYQAFLGQGVRTLPDISLNADSFQAIFFDGGLTGSGGTSIVAPELAGFMAMENAYLLYLQSLIGNNCFGHHACSPIGAANYYIYIEMQNAPYAPHYPFYDVTSGCASNDINAASNIPFFCAAPGYDMATGLGTANMLQLAWTINYSAAGDFGPPQALFFGVPINTWFNTDQFLNITVTDTTASIRPATGVAGFSLGWDVDPAPESFSRPTPGSNDAFYDGPSFANQDRGGLSLAQAGQGCHFAKVKAWDNTGTSSGVLSYGPVCFDSVAPVTTVSLSGTSSGSVFTSGVKVTLAATDAGSGVATKSYLLDGGAAVPYSAPFNITAAGNHTVVFFSKDVAGNSETAKTKTFTINLPKTTTQVTSSLNPSTFTDSVTLTAKVTPASGAAATGTITFMDGSTVLATRALSNGVASFPTTALRAGAHSVTAVYNGSGHDQSSTSAILRQTVNKATSTISVTSSLNPSTFGQSVKITASVVSSRTGALTGTVTFKDGSTIIGSGSLNGVPNKVALVTTTLGAGTHHITAIYSGSSDDAGSTSAALTDTVSKATTVTALTSSLNPATQGASVTLTATVAPQFGGLTGGTVTFKDGTKTLGTGAVDATTRKAAFTTSALSVGTHSVTAVYGGTTNLGGSTSAAFNQVVK